MPARRCIATQSACGRLPNKHFKGVPMHTRFALYLQDKHNMQYELEMVRYAE